MERENKRPCVRARTVPFFLVLFQRGRGRSCGRQDKKQAQRGLE